jgi:MFS family permease
VLIMLGFGAIAALICESAVADWSAIWLREDLGASAGAAGFGFLAFSATQAAGRFAGDGAVRRLGRARTIAVLGSIGALGLGLGLAAGSLPAGHWAVPAAIGGFALIGVGVAVMFPVTISAAAEVGKHPGAGIATVTTMGYTAFLAAPTLIGQLGERLGLTAAMWALPVLAGAATVLIVRACAATGAAQPSRDLANRL